MERKQQIQKPILSALFCALIVVGSYIVIPMVPVPIVLATYFILTVGALLGWKWGFATVALYLFLGVIGLPVFSGGKAGIGTLIGPTGGYLVGYLLAAGVAGLIAAPHKGRSLLRLILAILAGTFIIYLVGVLWLNFSTIRDFKKSLLYGLLPFLIGDGIKGVAAVLSAWFLIPLLYKSTTKVAKN